MTITILVHNDNMAQHKTNDLTKSDTISHVHILSKIMIVLLGNFLNQKHSVKKMIVVVYGSVSISICFCITIPCCAI